MCLELKSISKGNKRPIYCIQYRSNQGVKFAEMTINNINDKTFHLNNLYVGTKLGTI